MRGQPANFAEQCARARNRRPTKCFLVVWQVLCNERIGVWTVVRLPEQRASSLLRPESSTWCSRCDDVYIIGECPVAWPPVMERPGEWLAGSVDSGAGKDSCTTRMSPGAAKFSRWLWVPVKAQGGRFVSRQGGLQLRNPTPMPSAAWRLGTTTNRKGGEVAVVSKRSGLEVGQIVRGAERSAVTCATLCESPDLANAQVRYTTWFLSTDLKRLSSKKDRSNGVDRREGRDVVGVPYVWIHCAWCPA
jgi:hypothetical protein